jgi:hypothetical protein
VLQQLLVLLLAGHILQVLLLVAAAATLLLLLLLLLLGSRVLGCKADLGVGSTWTPHSSSSSSAGCPRCHHTISGRPMNHQTPQSPTALPSTLLLVQHHPLQQHGHQLGSPTVPCSTMCGSRREGSMQQQLVGLLLTTTTGHHTLA